MNTVTKATLLVIMLVLAGMIASFIRFVTTWDKDGKDAIVLMRPSEEGPA